MSRTFTKINLLFLFTIIMLSGCKKDEPNTSGFEDIQFPNENALSWDYPVKPGSDKWKTFQSYAEKVEACQIPKSILSSLPTEELVLICLKYPLLMDIGAFNFFTDGYAAYEANCNGIKELYKRIDAPIIIFSYYRQLKLENATMYSSIFFVFRVSVIEYMISSPSVISKYSATQRKEVTTELMSKLNIKKSLSGDFTNTYQNSTYLALIKIIKCDETGKLPSDDAKLANYFAGGFSAPESIVKQVNEMISKYLSGK